MQGRESKQLYAVDLNRCRRQYSGNMKLERYRLAVLIVICILIGGLLAYGFKGLFSPGQEDDAVATPEKLHPKPVKVKAHLYFLDEHRQYLKAEERTLTRQDSLIEYARSIVHALIRGPEGELLPTLPTEAKLLSIFVTEDGIAYVDFDAAAAKKHPGGALSELFTIFSVVNTLSLNISEVEAVKILIEGREAKTLAGHIDIRYPFWPDILMIK